MKWEYREIGNLRHSENISELAILHKLIYKCNATIIKIIDIEKNKWWENLENGELIRRRGDKCGR